VHHRTAGGAAAVGHLGEEFDLFTAQQAGNLVFRHLVHGVGAEAVYFFRVDSGIGQGGQGGLHRQTQFGTAGILGKLGGAQAGNRGLAAKQCITHLSVSYAGRTRLTVPAAWLPMEFLPLRVITTERVASSRALTSPVKVMVSPG